ncbi:MBL fold metallo-hydrolase [Caldibacillus debilis]|jgi:glyoxylase-like metal-dependent hydrolase (beta-lactamase superfamily II)|uniref:Zn-dependent hydrolase, including glyoxylase n=1 Tax=Caldibacillus debilis GB1 TaxID=1339248 RepID=A0A420VGD6_9BACI|nr:MBL fold metallo-hydrolase [Caldibacillus debilis]RKO62714.1 Zn-dependent hydrolase, including glyoxylase [Caldibacillus debilis GB1]
MRIVRKHTIFQLTFLPRLFPVNCYLVDEPDGLTLIDAALPYSAKGILKAAETIGKPITRILLTHAHQDHVGALDGLKRILPDAPVFVSERDARLMAGDRSLDPDEPNTPIRGGVPKNLRTRADVLLKEGDRIGSLLVIATPGHTPGSMSFLDTRNRACIAGDAFQTRGGIAVSGQVQPWFPFPAMATWNKEIALKSACKIREHRPSLLAAGHGGMLEQPGPAIDRAIAEAERRFR